MYTRSVQIYDTLYHFKDYAREAAAVLNWIEGLLPEAASLLDVGCATGRHLEHWQDRFKCEGVDISEEFLAIARRRCPRAQFHVADMRRIDLGQRFDVVTCLFSAIAMAAKTEPELRHTVARLAAHLRPGGLLIVEPWFTPETYWTNTITSNTVDQPDLKIVWMYTSTRENNIAVLDTHYLVGRPSGVDYFRERLECALFSDETYRDAMRAAELDVRHEAKAFGRGMYFGVKRHGETSKSPRA